VHETLWLANLLPNTPSPPNLFEVCFACPLPYPNPMPGWRARRSRLASHSDCACAVHVRPVHMQERGMDLTRLHALSPSCLSSLSPAADIWNMRTWAWATHPHWSVTDMRLYLNARLCTNCRKRGVNTIEAACKRCGVTKRRGRPSGVPDNKFLVSSGGVSSAVVALLIPSRQVEKEQGGLRVVVCSPAVCSCIASRLILFFFSSGCVFSRMSRFLHTKALLFCPINNKCQN